MTLTDFLLARIDEVEALIDGPWSEGYDGLHIITDDRYRWLRAECEAKRRIVEEHSGRHSCGFSDYEDGHPTWGTCPTLQHLAAVYSDHPDYRPEWSHDVSAPS